MNQVRLVADSSCDLLTLSGMDFVSVPLTIRTETEEFRDDAALDVDGMVRALRDTNGRSYSACLNVADWEGAFGGRVRIGHCQNEVLAQDLCSELLHLFPQADIKSYPLRGLCSYYAERGGIMLGFET